MAALTPAQLAAGVAAAADYEGFASNFVGQSRNEGLVKLVEGAADAAKDQSPAGRQAAAVSALTAVIAQAGDSSMVSADQIAGITAAVLAAVASAAQV